MFQFSLFTWIAFLTAVIPFFMSILIFLCGKDKLHKVWGYFNCSVAWWAFFIFLASLSTDSRVAYDFWRISHIGGFFTTVFFMHTACIFCNLNFPKLIKFSYIYECVHSLLQFVNGGSFLYRPEGTKYLFFSIHYIQVKPLIFFLCFSPWTFFLLFALYQLIKYYRANKNQAGAQALVWIAGTGIGYAGGVLTIVPMVGVNFYPVTMILTPLYDVLITYTIFRHQFMDIRIVFERGIVYSILIAASTVFYLVSVVVLEKFFQHYIGYQATWASITSAFIIGIAFFPLRNGIQGFLDRKFFMGSQAEIAEQNRQLRQGIRQAHRYKTLVSFINTVLHEIKNPLTALKVYSMKLPENVDNKELLAEMSAEMNKKISKIFEVIENLNRYSQPVPLKLERTDIIALINKAVEACQKRFPNLPVGIYTYFHAPTQMIEVDPRQIQQVMENIIKNAFESMPDGGQLWVGTEKARRHIKIFIKDIGRGISQEDVANIFDPFYRINKESAGLGLSTAQGIIENHNGRILVESKENVGTEFTIELPSFM